MNSIHFGEKLEVRKVEKPSTIPAGEALIKTRIAGICNTDLEIVRGYFGFQGILGHEFVGEVVECPDDPNWVGKRVVGEINAWCGECETCRRGDPTHCPNRTTLGIYKRNGAMSEYFTLPSKLLLEVPESVADEEAVFTEPLAAACEILEQIQIHPTDRVAVLGDGKLGNLIAQVLHLTGCSLTVIGKHRSKLDLLFARGIDVYTKDQEIPGGFDIVVEATGSPAGFAKARSLVRPRGTMVLKSTFHGDVDLNLSMVVVDEVRLIGSRCGPFAPAIRLLENKQVDVKSLIHGTYPLASGLEAFQRATERGVLKILLNC